ncbi:574_t:CDS:1, partial [Cetraspora pellucida]
MQKGQVIKKKVLANNINLIQFGLANDIIIKSDENSEYKTQLNLLDIHLNLDNYKDRTDNCIIFNDAKNYISSEDNSENTEYETNLITTSFSFYFESDS